MINTGLPRFFAKSASDQLRQICTSQLSASDQPRQICTSQISASDQLRQICTSQIGASDQLRQICTSQVSASDQLRQICTSQISASDQLRQICILYLFLFFLCVSFWLLVVKLVFFYRLYIGFKAWGREQLLALAHT